MINWMISSSTLILIVICMRYFLKERISAKLQYALWLLVAVRLLVPISFGSSTLSIENITNRFFTIQHDVIIQHVEQENRIEQSGNSNEVVYQEMIAAERIPGSEINEETHYVSENVYADTGIKGFTLLFVFWALGVVGITAIFAITNIKFQKKVRKSRKSIYVNWCKRPIYISDGVEEPCLVGIFFPTIYVTKEVAENGRLFQHTVTHEYMHYKQGDSLWTLIRCMCLALHWYNPLVWLVAILSKKDAEFACDEATIKELGENERKEYGKTLIQLSSRERYNLFLTATAMTSGKNSIKERILLIAKKPKVKWYTLMICGLVSCIAVGCTFTQGENRMDSQLEMEENIDRLETIIETQNKIEDDTVQGLPMDNQSVELIYYEEADSNKVCLAVMPDGISRAGGDYRFIIPEDQTKWVDGYKQMQSLASGNGKWKKDECSMGVWVVYGDEWTCITDQGFIYDLEKRVEKSKAEDFYTLCMTEARKYGTGTPNRPEDFVNITYAKILGEESYPIRDEYILDEIENALNSSVEIRGGSSCPFTIPLYVELDNKGSKVIHLASDSCSAWLSDGVYYEDTYGIVEGLRDMIEVRQMVMEFTAAYFKNDVETLQAYMMPISSVKVEGYSGGEEPPALWSFAGLESCIDAHKFVEYDFKTKIFVEFQVSEEPNDLANLKIFLRKHEGEWKVEAYVLE